MTARLILATLLGVLVGCTSGQPAPVNMCQPPQDSAWCAPASSPAPHAHTAAKE